MAINRGQTPGHVSRYFGFFSDFVRLLNKGDGNFITHDQLEELEKRHEAPLQSLLENAVIIEIDSVYELDRRVLDFVAFCNNDFALNSPETVKKFHYSLSKLYEKLLAAREDNEIIRYANQLISELSGFSVALEESVTRLLKDALSLKENIGELSPIQRFDMASEIIDEYVSPLKEIIEDRSDAILPLVRNIMSLANIKTGQLDRNMDAVLRRLRLKADTAHKDTERFGRQILSELLTLRKIKKASISLEGAIAWLENMDELDPSNICSPYPTTVHSKEYFFEAIDELDWLIESEEEIEIPSDNDILENMETHYHFNKERFLGLFKEEESVDNLYLWIYDRLKEDDDLSYKSFCAAMGIIDELKVVSSDKREVLSFEDFRLNVPMASATITTRG